MIQMDSKENLSYFCFVECWYNDSDIFEVYCNTLHRIEGSWYDSGNEGNGEAQLPSIIIIIVNQ